MRGAMLRSAGVALRCVRGAAAAAPPLVPRAAPLPSRVAPLSRPLPSRGARALTLLPLPALLACAEQQGRDWHARPLHWAACAALGVALSLPTVADCARPEDEPKDEDGRWRNKGHGVYWQTKAQWEAENKRKSVYKRGRRAAMDKEQKAAHLKKQNEYDRAWRERKKAVAEAEVARLLASGACSGLRSYSTDEMDEIVGVLKDYVCKHADGTVNLEAGMYAGLSRLHTLADEAQKRAFQYGHRECILLYEILPFVYKKVLKFSGIRGGINKVTGKRRSRRTWLSHRFAQDWEVGCARSGTSKFSTDTDQAKPGNARVLRAWSGIAVGRVNKHGYSRGHGGSFMRLKRGDFAVRYMLLFTHMSSAGKLATANYTISDTEHGTGAIVKALRVKDWTDPLRDLQQGARTRLSLEEVVDLAREDRKGSFGPFVPTLAAGVPLENVAYNERKNRFYPVPPAGLWNKIKKEAKAMAPKVMRKAAACIKVSNRRQLAMLEAERVQADLDAGVYPEAERPAMRKAARAPFKRQRPNTSAKS